MYHPKMHEFNRRLKVLFDEIDDYLEEKYGGVFTLRPKRPRRGSTSNKSQDGLFNVGPQFTPGYGSRFGRGYVVDMKIAAVEIIDSRQREEIENELIQVLNEKIKTHFPERELEVKRDIHGLKIVGNFNLGSMS